MPPPWAGARAEELVPASPGVASRSRPDFIFAVSSKRPHRGTDLLSSPTPSTARAFVGVSPAAGPEPAKENVLVAVCIWLPARARTRKAVLGFLPNLVSLRGLCGAEGSVGVADRSLVF